MKIKNIIYQSFVLLFFSSLTSCTSLTKFINYSYRHGPRFAFLGRAKHHQLDDNKIKVVSYNIKHSKKISKALSLLQKEKNLSNADIILLQEMTPEGVKKIANALQYDYVFYPAVRHPLLKTGFGNAIVSKWPIINDHKVILPAVKPKARNRIAVGATLLINKQKVVVYSLHMGVFVNPLKRKKIVDYLIKSLPENAEYCIIAGDFNSFTKNDREYIKKAFSNADFYHATDNVGWTYNQWYFMNRKSALDHIYAKGVHRIDSGKILNRNPSDHLPIWVDVTLIPELALEHRK